MLWFTQITKKILGTDPVKIIFESFTQSQELARYRYFGSFIICSNNFIGELSLLKCLRTFLASITTSLNSKRKASEIKALFSGSSIS
jgi:hypothetical protein